MGQRDKAQSSPWDVWIVSKLFLDHLNAKNDSEVGFRRGPQTFIQFCQA